MLMVLKKQTVILNGAKYKGKTINAIGGTVSHQPSINYILSKILALSRLRGAAANVQALPPQYEDQILQILDDMKEQQA